MRFPNELEFPTEVDPKIDLEEVVIPGHTGRQLVAHLPATENRTLTLRLRCAINEQDDELVRAPDIRFPDADQLPRFVVLPKLFGSTPIRWDTSGLQAAEMPPKHESIQTKYPTADIYQIVGPHMQAQLKTPQPIQGIPQVHLADYRLQWSSNHRCHGLATFDIEPAGLNAVALKLPEGIHVVHVAVGTVTVSAQRVTDRQWNIPLGTTALPQHIEVLFDGRFERIDAGDETKTFVAPTIVDLPCLATLWTIQGPTHCGEGAPLLAHTRSDRLNVANQRLETAYNLFRSAPIVVGREAMTIADPWRTNREQWIKQLEIDVFHAKSEAYRANLAKTSTIDRPALSIPRYDIAALWSIPNSNDGPITYGTLRGAAPRFEVQYRNATWHNLRGRLLAAGLLFAAMFVALRLRRIELVSGILVRYPEFAVAVLGFAWWMWLRPSFAGFVTMIFAAAMSLRSPWKTRPT
jgi:hypothetical protein